MRRSSHESLIIQHQRDAIDAQLRVYIETELADIEPELSANGRQAFAVLQEFVLRPGKRLRGVLGTIGYEMFGGMQRETALNLAVAIELAQAYLLIVDDVMDCSEQRRGGPTVHRQFQELLHSDGFTTKDGEHLGNMLAINVGLLVQHMTAGLLEELCETPERSSNARVLFQKNMVTTGLGQIDDLFHAAGQQITEADIRHMYEQKTASYSFVNPLQTGAALAGATERDLELLRRFGLHAGVAYQIQDDIIGMFGSPAETGKSSMDDLREGKRTLLMHYALEHAGAAQLAVLNAALGNSRATEKQHAAVQRVLVTTGARVYAEREAERSMQAAREVLKKLPGRDVRNGLTLDAVLDHITGRNK